VSPGTHNRCSVFMDGPVQELRAPRPPGAYLDGRPSLEDADRQDRTQDHEHEADPHEPERDPEGPFLPDRAVFLRKSSASRSQASLGFRRERRVPTSTADPAPAIEHVHGLPMQPGGRPVGRDVGAMSPGRPDFPTAHGLPDVLPSPMAWPSRKIRPPKVCTLSGRGEPPSRCPARLQGVTLGIQYLVPGVRGPREPGPLANPRHRTGFTLTASRRGEARMEASSSFPEERPPRADRMGQRSRV